MGFMGYDTTKQKTIVEFPEMETNRLTSAYHTTEKIQEDSVMLYELKTNDNNLEKYAREQFFMKANDEDVFEIVETE